jgi:hypothetical protein
VLTLRLILMIGFMIGSKGILFSNPIERKSHFVCPRRTEGPTPFRREVRAGEIRFSRDVHNRQGGCQVSFFYLEKIAKVAYRALPLMLLTKVLQSLKSLCFAFLTGGSFRNSLQGRVSDETEYPACFQSIYTSAAIND